MAVEGSAGQRTALGRTASGPVRQVAGAANDCHASRDRRAGTDHAHSGIYDTPAGPRLDVPDPDGTVVRFYYYTGPTDQFTGLEMHDGRSSGPTTLHGCNNPTPRPAPASIPGGARLGHGRDDPELFIQSSSAQALPGLRRPAKARMRRLGMSHPGGPTPDAPAWLFNPDFPLGRKL
jgi:hypothetical protein